MAIGFVRPAVPGDAAAIARLQVGTWQTAYSGILPRSALANLDVAWATDRWLDAIVAPPTGRHHVVVAVEQPDAPPATGVAASAYLVGFAAIGPADVEALAPDEPPDALGSGVAAVTELLVQPRWGRRGHGSRLLSACADLCRADRFTGLVCWIFAEDRATGRFLASAGWAPDGVERSLDVDDLLVPQVRMHTSIGTADTQPDVTST